MVTLTRVLAIVGLAALLGAGHLLTRQRPIDLSVDVIEAPAEPTDASVDPSATPPTEPPADTPDVAPADTGTAAEPVAEPAAEPAGPRVTKIGLIEAAELYNEGAPFLDARTEREFSAGRIYGAFWMPAQRVFTEEGQADLDFVDPAMPVVIYCTGGECDASHNTIARINALGLGWTDIRIMTAGYDDWVAADLPVEGAE